MKFTIHGFSQQKAIELGLSNDDLLTLRWIIDFSQSGKMKSIYRNGKVYYWINYKSLLDDIPILNIKKDTLYRRLKKMSNIGVLSHTTVIDNGTYSYYGVGDKYIELLSNNFSAPAYNQEYEGESDINPRGSDINPNGTDANPKGSTDVNPNPTDENPYQRPYILDKSTRENQSTISNKEKKSTSAKVDQLKKQFDLLWSLYPKGRKQGKEAARKAFIKAIKDGVEFETIQNALIAYNQQIEIRKTETQYIKMGSTWFSQKCWEDEYEVDTSNSDDEYGERLGVWL